VLFRVGITRRGSGYGELLHGNNGRGLTRFAVVLLKSVAEVLPSAVIASSPAVFAADSAAAVLVEEVLSSVERRRM